MSRPSSIVESPEQPLGTLLPGTVINFPKHQVQIDKFLAEGGYAHVYVAVSSLMPGKPCVLKRVHCPTMAHVVATENEVTIHKRLSGHKNIVSFYDFLLQPDQGGMEMLILMEYCRDGHLVSYMNARLETRLAEPEILSIFSNVCEAVAHMHSFNPPYIHRDIKIENVLLSDSVFKLCDFGSCTTQTILPGASIPLQEIRQLEDEISRVTTLQYRAPEMCDLYQRKGMTEKVDMWAMGVLLYKLCFYTTPFEDGGKLAILNVKYSIPSHRYSHNLMSLIDRMLQSDSTKRWSIWQVYQSVCELRNVPFPFMDQLLVSKRSMSALPLELKPIALGSIPMLNDPVPQAQITPMRRGRPQKGSNGNILDALSDSKTDMSFGLEVNPHYASGNLLHQSSPHPSASPYSNASPNPSVLYPTGPTPSPYPTSSPYPIVPTSSPYPNVPTPSPYPNGPVMSPSASFNQSFHGQPGFGLSASSNNQSFVNSMGHGNLLNQSHPIFQQFPPSFQGQYGQQSPFNNQDPFGQNTSFVQNVPVNTTSFGQNASVNTTSFGQNAPMNTTSFGQNASMNQMSNQMSTGGMNSNAMNQMSNVPMAPMVSMVPMVPSSNAQPLTHSRPNSFVNTMNFTTVNQPNGYSRPGSFVPQNPHDPFTPIPPPKPPRTSSSRNSQTYN